MLFSFSTGLELALKCLKDQNYEKIIDACKEELDKTNNSLLRRTYALNLHATFSILCGNCDIGIEYLSIVIETPKVQVKVYTFFSIFLFYPFMLITNIHNI